MLQWSSTFSHAADWGTVSCHIPRINVTACVRGMSVSARSVKRVLRAILCEAAASSCGDASSSARRALKGVFILRTSSIAAS